MAYEAQAQLCGGAEPVGGYITVNRPTCCRAKRDVDVPAHAVGSVALVCGREAPLDHLEMLDAGVHVRGRVVPIRNRGDTVGVVAVVGAVTDAGGELGVVTCLDGYESGAGGGDGGVAVRF